MRPPRRGLAAACLSVAALACCSAAAAQATSQPIERQVREALRRRADRTWYDASADEARAVVLPKERRPPPPVNTRSGGGAPSTFDLNLQWALRLLLFVLLAIVAVALFYAYRRMVGRRTMRLPKSSSGPIRPAAVVDISALPDEATDQIDDLLAAADAEAAAGRLQRALIYLFSHELLLLHESGAISLDRGKTNRVYLREAIRRPELAAPFQRVIHHFERVYFGGKMLSLDDWRTLRDEESHFPHGETT